MSIGRRTLLGAGLAAPGLARTATLAARTAASAPVTAPLEFFNEARILVPMTVDGHAAEGWIDSGSDDSVIDAGFAKSLGLSAGGAFEAIGVSQHYQAHRIHAELAVGGRSIPAPRLAMADLNPLPNPARPVQVILGGDLFRAGVVEIDLPARRLTLWPRAAFRPPPEAPVPLSPLGLLRTAPISIDGHALQAELDLGNTGAVLLDQTTAERLGIGQGRPFSTVLSHNVDGFHEPRITSLPSLSVAGLTVHGAPATLQPLASSAPANIGVAVLSRFHMWIDFVGNAIWLQPLPGAADAPFRKDRSGVYVRNAGDQLVVVYVAHPSPALAAGLRKDDVITAIDGRPIATYPKGSISPMLAGPPGRTIAFTLADGTSREVTLADYY